MSGTSWVTLATNDSYSLGALVLGHSLRRVGTVHHLTVLITPGVTQPMRDKLSKVFNTVKEVNVLDSRDQANLALLSRPELGITFTKLNCWRLTQFSKGVFLDADTLVLQNCDELFDREELSAAPDAGWPDCFNSGVFVFRPSEATYQALIQFAVTNGSFDGGDQGLLNLFFADWATKDISRHLPFIYNMVSTATYSYLPAFKQFGSNVKIAHFIGAAKPWLQYFDTESQKVTPPPSSTHLQGLLQIWWDIFCSQVHPDLSQDMAGLAGALAQLTLGVPRSAEQTALEEHLRRQSWEQGNADYLGRDSFDNIWKKISETLAQVPEPKVEENKPQDIEARIAEPAKITEVPLSQPTPPEFISELKLQCTEPKVESTPTSNSESTSPVTSAAPVDQEPVISSTVTDTTLEKNPEQNPSVNNVEDTNQSSANIVTETIPTFISEYPPVDQTILSDSPAATALNETQNITQPLKDTIPTNIEQLKDISLATIQEKDNEKSKSLVATEILESASDPQGSLITSDQQPLPEEFGKATNLTETPTVEQVPIAATKVTPIVSSQPESSQSEVDPKLDVKEPIASTEQIILSQTTELPPATELPLPVNVVTDIGIPSQADSNQTLPTVLSGCELLPTLTSAGISPTILESSGIQMPIDQPPFVKLSDIIQPQQSETPTETCDEKGVPAVPDLVPVIEKPVSSPVTTPPIESTGLEDAVGSASDSTIKSTQPDSTPQTPDSPVTKPVSTALVAVPKKRPGKLPEPPKPTIALPAPDSASTPPISSQPPLDLPSSTDAQILAAGVISLDNSESVLLSPILPSPEVTGIDETQSTLIQNDIQPSIAEDSILSDQGKTEITSQAPETAQNKQVSKEADKQQTPTGETKITLEKQLSKESVLPVQEKAEITSQAPETDQNNQVSKEADKPQTPTVETKITLEKQSSKESVLPVQEKTEITSQAPETIQNKQVSKEADKPQTPTGETKMTLEKQSSKESVLPVQEKTEITSQAPETVQNKQVSKEADKPQTPTGETKITLEKPLSKESVLSAQEKTEITSKAPETVENKQDSKEADKPKTSTEATKITLEKQSSKEEKQGGKLSDTDSKLQTKPSKVIKQSSKETESATKPDVIQPAPTAEPTPVKPKPKGLKGPKGPKSPPIKDAPQTPPPAKDVPQTPPPIKGTPQTPTVTAATPPISPISTPLTSPNSESLKVDQTQPETPPVTSTTPDVSGSSSQETAAKDPSEAISPPVPPKRKNAKSAAAQSTEGAKPAQPKVSKPVKPKK